MRPGIRVVLASGYPRGALSDRGLTKDFDFIAKPYRWADLAETLRQLRPGAPVHLVRNGIDKSVFASPPRVEPRLEAADPAEAAFARVATAVGKYWLCRRAPAFVNEAQECLGGNGYVEESLMPRLYRQAPLNSIWEGSGNIQCLDVLRALAREPESAAALFAELGKARGLHEAFDRTLATLQLQLADTESLELRARRMVETMALALTAGVLLRGGDPEVADIYCRSRLDGDRGGALGTLPRDAPFAQLIERAFQD